MGSIGGTYSDPIPIIKEKDLYNFLDSWEPKRDQNVLKEINSYKSVEDHYSLHTLKLQLFHYHFRSLHQRKTKRKKRSFTNKTKFTS